MSKVEAQRVLSNLPRVIQNKGLLPGPWAVLTPTLALNIKVYRTNKARTSLARQPLKPRSAIRGFQRHFVQFSSVGLCGA